MRTVILILLSVLLSRPASSEPQTPLADRRSEDQTFLTFPEWYLVHSPAEYAKYLAADRPLSEFPFWGHLHQLWGGYMAVTEASKPYPFNGGYHLMISVIASSTTIEYGLRSVYETLIGRLTELASVGQSANEDHYAARVAQDYVDFIRVLPWYEFDFWSRLRGLWQVESREEDSLLRKWERRYVLTTEYLAKAIYAELIKLGTQSIYDVAALQTVIVLDRVPANLPAELTDYKSLATGSDGSVMASVPRYDSFKQYAVALANEGVRFREIAGNAASAKILVTALVPTAWRVDEKEAALLFEQPILTQHDRKRVGLVTTVNDLSTCLLLLQGQEVEIEHVHDY